MEHRPVRIHATRIVLHLMGEVASRRAHACTSLFIQGQESVDPCRDRRRVCWITDPACACSLDPMPGCVASYDDRSAGSERLQYDVSIVLAKSREDEKVKVTEKTDNLVGWNRSYVLDPPRI